MHQPKILHPGKSFLKIEREIKIFSDICNLREFITRRPSINVKISSRATKNDIGKRLGST